ncbi:MAG TPA: alpha/beta hydrolase-fold protein [Bdellovibrionales bacterium]|nr:alpha/beta hydrolase-fold protein [Bdellovibrionales bacterium]
MNSKRILSGLVVHSLQSFEIRTLIVDSLVLRENPLGDKAERRSPVLVPFEAAPRGGWPVVLVLSGFTGNGAKAFNTKFAEESWPETLDKLVYEGSAPKAVYVFVDAMTFWGGSQFIDSDGLGRYATYITDELVPEIRAGFSVAESADSWAIMGGSSGGYGALHLTSLRPDIFGWCLAIAPDSFFDASLLNEIRTALPLIAKIGGVAAVRRELEDGKLLRRKDWHVIVNAIAMGLAYAGDRSGTIRWPIDAETGIVRQDIWAEWLEWDPMFFLRARSTGVKKLAGVYLDVGTRDQFHLQYGTRLIAGVLKDLKVNSEVREFDGTHFEIGERRPDALAWLVTQWRG